MTLGLSDRRTSSGPTLEAFWGAPQDAEERSFAPPNWMPYFGIESADASAERASALGGSVLLPPMDIPSGGRIAAVADPQGAALGLWEGEMED